MDFRLGSALAGIHEGGNVVEDVHFFGGTHAIVDVETFARLAVHAR